MDNKDLSSLSIKQLKDILTDRGVDFADCFEKSDLIRKVKENIDKPKVDPAATSTYPSKQATTSKKGGIRESKQKIANLDCIICDNIEENEQPEFIIIVSHGFGANNADLVPIGKHILVEVPHKLRFVFPNAPIILEGQSRAWWPLDMNQLMMKIMMGDLKSVFVDVPPGLSKAREYMMELIKEVEATNNLSTSKMILCGFSQGSMLSTDVALHLEDQLAGLAVFSGVGICQQEWVQLATKHKGLKVFQSHGTQDMLLPYQLGVMLKDFFEKSEMDLSFVSFNDGHTIAPKAIQQFTDWLKKIIKEAS